MDDTAEGDLLEWLRAMDEDARDAVRADPAPLLQLAAAHGYGQVLALLMDDFGTRPRARPPADEPAPSEALACVVCLANKRQLAPQECGHLSVCFACGRRVAACPVCRKPIAKKMNRVFV